MQNKIQEKLVNDALDKSSVVALIYSPVELHKYIVEIISKDYDKFIQTGDEITHFKSVDQALLHAKNYGAEEFFLCVDNTYDECGSMGSGQKFDYIPIYSKNK